MKMSLKKSVRSEETEKVEEGDMIEVTTRDQIEIEPRVSLLKNSTLAINNPTMVEYPVVAMERIRRNVEIVLEVKTVEEKMAMVVEEIVQDQEGIDE